MQKTKSQGTQESENKFFKVKENVEAMRIQLFFEGKPEPEVRDILKSNGFRWAPSVGAWQRQLNNNGKTYSRSPVFPGTSFSAGS